MIKLYSRPNTSSSKKASSWLKMNGIEFQEINIFKHSLTMEDILGILSVTDEGVEDILSFKSHAYQALGIDFEHVSLHQLVNLIIENRAILRTPLIVDDKRLQVGFNDDDIRKFLPSRTRAIKLKGLSDKAP
jgi:regulatory protein spx